MPVRRSQHLRRPSRLHRCPDGTARGGAGQGRGRSAVPSVGSAGTPAARTPSVVGTTVGERLRLGRPCPGGEVWRGGAPLYLAAFRFAGPTAALGDPATQAAPGNAGASGR